MKIMRDKPTPEQIARKRLIATADALLGILGYKRKMIVEGNVITPNFEREEDENRRI